MTARELHIGLDIGLNKIKSNKLRSFEPQEYDWILNEAQLQFIRNRVNPKSNPLGTGFEEETNRYEDIQAVLRVRELPVYAYTSNSVFAFLPSDYFLPIRDISKVKWSCDEFTPLSASTNVYYSVVDIGEGGANAPYFTGFKLQLVDTLATVTDLFDLTTFPNYSAGFNSNEEKFAIINLLLDELNAIPGVEAFWEKWNGRYYRNRLIIVTSSPTTGLPLNNTEIRINNGISTTVFPFVGLSLTGYSTSGLNELEVPNRLTKTNNVEDMLGHNAGKTHYKSPVSEIQDGKIITYFDKKFIVSATKFRYIRKPRRIDILLNQTSELSVNVHEQVVNLAVQKCKALLDDTSYEKFVRENSIQE